MVYTWILGEASALLESAGIRVVDDLSRLPARPDVIQGHQHAVLLGALQRYPDVPAVFVCHDHTGSWDRPTITPQVRRYLGVSELCRQRLLRDGAPPNRTGLSLNSVDLDLFKPRPPLPPSPETVLVFSNYARKDTHLPAVEEACRRAGVELEVVGRSAGNGTSRPETVLPGYDVVFAKAKAAMEAMAVGAAVVLCDFGGVGPMVTSSNFESLRPLNFGYAALTQPLTAENVLAQLRLYDRVDAEKVSALIRERAGLTGAVDEMVATYRAVVAEAHDAPFTASHPGRLRVAWQRILTGVIVLYCRRYGMESRRLPMPLRQLYRLTRAVVSRL
jgi:hypothetical protein